MCMCVYIIYISVYIIYILCVYIYKHLILSVSALLKIDRCVYVPVQACVCALTHAHTYIHGLRKLFLKIKRLICKEAPCPLGQEMVYY